MNYAATTLQDQIKIRQAKLDHFFFVVDADYIDVTAMSLAQ